MPNDETFSSELHSTINAEWMHLQLNSYDFYMSKPTILDARHGSSLPMNEYVKVPVIRVYGFLPSGHQVLCHIHGIFPYIYIRYDGHETDSSAVMNQNCAQLHDLLEKKSQLSVTKNKDKTDPKKTKFNALSFIANISVVKGVPFYGFHVGWSLFYKISLLNAGFVNKLSELLREGQILGKKVETYESQLPYLLQFSADFNLFGCSWIDFCRCYFRKPVLNTTLDLDKLFYNDDLKSLLQQFCDPESNVLPEKDFARMGNGLLEIDILPQFIRNIDEIQCRNLHHDFVEKLSDSTNRHTKPYVTSTKNIMKDIAIHRRILSLEPYAPASDVERIEAKTKWQSSSEYQNDFNHAKQRVNSTECKNPDFSTFINNNSNLENIKMPHESLPELWPIPPDFAALSKNPDVNVIDTMEQDYNIANISDYEGEVFADSRDASPLPDVDKEEFTKPQGEIRDMSYSRISMDSYLTQTMAKKKRKTLEIQTWSSGKRNMKKAKFEWSGIRYDRGSYSYKRPQLQYDMILDDLEQKGYPKIDYVDPYFGNPLDLRQKPYIYAGKRFEITSNHLSSRIAIPFQEENIITSKETGAKKNVFSSWKYLRLPPTYTCVEKEVSEKANKRRFESQLENPTSKNGNFFGINNDQPAKRSKSKLHNTLTHFSLEVHIQTKGSKLPDPQNDEVKMIVWCLEKDSFPFDLNVSSEGIMIVKSLKTDESFAERVQQAAGKVPVALYDDEFDLFDALIDLVLIFDPDILSGFELHAASWGYILERCRKIHHFEIADEFSRVNTNMKTNVRDKWGYTHASGIHINGRHVINVWRALRSELNLTQYTIENITYKVFQERLPHFSFEALTGMWNDNKDISKLKTVISYWMNRVRLNIALLQKQEYIPRITEQSRLTGIDFYSVYYRGSQYKIESILCRLCKAESFLLLAPSRKEVRKQKALECVPLVMEPESAFYKSPMVVLDFQSLYPSIMIAYNYCYSTMLGRVRDLKLENNEIGVTKLSLRKSLLTLLENDITIAPNGVAYVKSSVRKSTLAKMLEDILDTRLIVKKTMTDTGKGNLELRKLLNSRQLALKLIANVTYGYTSASFSGRMPCSDLADSIVQTGRETLEKAIDFIESNVNWGAKVVYGDTDSLFIYLPGKSREEAFTIGHDMANAVTSRNPVPIVLKFEKVYHPSLLLTKKRYVGFMYEKVTQKNPTFDAKGIETVRRDGHPAQQKIVEKSIRILFETKDLSQVKKYVQNEFTKIHQGTVTVQDFCFAKEVRLGTYKSDKTAPPGAVVAARQIEIDHRARPQQRERVPYLVIRGSAGQTLRERCLSPEEFFANENLELDSDYYINKTLVPPLERLFNVLGINVSEWAFDVPRYRNMGTSNIDINAASAQCVCCNSEVTTNNKNLLCEKCITNSRETASKIVLGRSLKEQRFKTISAVCRTCSFRYSHDSSEVGDKIASYCNSYDCPVYFGRIKAQRFINSNKDLKYQKALETMNHW